jgi:gamma-glutamylputrescine oxidase
MPLIGQLSHLTYYEARHPPPPLTPPLLGILHADVCIVGGGLAGLSAALELAAGGYRVRVLEAGAVGHGASGRNGGQVLPGVAASQRKLVKLVGAADARKVWDLSLEAVALLRQRIALHAITCDLRSGHLHVANQPRHVAELVAWQRELRDEYGYDALQLLDANELPSLLSTQRYHGALYDCAAAHLDPLAYTRGLASAALRAGAIIHEYSPALDYRPYGRNALMVRTAQGALRCEHLLLAGNALLGNFEPQLQRKVLGVGTYMIATEPLSAQRATALITNDASVSDMNWVLDYFRRTADHRLLFGGRVSYGGLHRAPHTGALRRRMLQVFPQLVDVRIDHSWGGWLDITMNRAPHFGRLAPNVWFLQGFSGQGLALTGIAGALAAEAIAGTAERFDVFARIPHRNFPGGPLLRQPALALAMLWYRLRDLL